MTPSLPFDFQSNGLGRAIQWFSIAYPMVFESLSIDGRVQFQWIARPKPLKWKSPVKARFFVRWRIYD